MCFNRDGFSCRNTLFSFGALVIFINELLRSLVSHLNVLDVDVLDIFLTSVDTSRRKPIRSIFNRRGASRGNKGIDFAIATRRLIGSLFRPFHILAQFVNQDYILSNRLHNPFLEDI